MKMKDILSAKDARLEELELKMIRMEELELKVTRLEAIIDSQKEKEKIVSACDNSPRPREDPRRVGQCWTGRESVWGVSKVQKREDTQVRLDMRKNV